MGNERDLYTFVGYTKEYPLDASIEFKLVKVFNGISLREIVEKCREATLFRDKQWILTHINEITNLRAKGKNIYLVGEGKWEDFPHDDGYIHTSGNIILYRLKDKNGRLLGCVTFDPLVGRIVPHNYLSLHVKFGIRRYSPTYNGTLNLLDRDNFLKPSRGRLINIITTERELDAAAPEPQEFSVIDEGYLRYMYLTNKKYGKGWIVGTGSTDEPQLLNRVPTTLYGINVIDIQNVLSKSKITVVSEEFIHRTWKLHQEIIKERNIKVLKIKNQTLDSILTKLKLTGLPEHQLLIIVEGCN